MVFKRQAGFIVLSALLLMYSSVFGQIPTVVDAVGFERGNGPFITVWKQGKSYLYNIHTGLLIDRIAESADDLYVVVRDGKYGAVNAKGHVLAELKFDEIRLETDYNGQWHEGISYNYKFIVTKKAGKFGLLDRNGGIISVPQFQYLVPIDSAVIAFADGKKWGWLSAKDGLILQKPIYHRVTKSYLLPGAISVYTEEKEGLARTDGTIIVPAIYNALWNMQTKSRHLISFENGNLSGLLDSMGHVVLPPRQATFEMLGNTDLLMIKTKAGVGCIDQQGKIVLPAEYSSIQRFVRGLAIVRKGKRTGVINEQGNFVLPLNFNEVEFIDAEGNTVYGENEVIVSSESPALETARETLLWNKHQMQISQQQFLIKAKDHDSTGLFNWAGETIEPLNTYSAIELMFKGGIILIKVVSGDHFFLHDITGNAILPFAFTYKPAYDFSGVFYDDTEYSDTSTNVIPLYKGDSLALFDLRSGAWVVEFAEQNIRWINGRYLQVTKTLNGGDYLPVIALFDSKGNFIRKFNNDVAQYIVIRDKLILEMSLDGGYQLLNLDGKTLYKNEHWKQRSFSDFRAPEPYDRDLFLTQELIKIAGTEENLFINDGGVESRYDDFEFVSYFRNHIAICGNRDSSGAPLYGMINDSQTVLLPPEYSHFERVYNNPELLLAQRHGKFGLITVRGNVLLEPVYDDLQFTSGLIKLSKAGKVGLANENGDILLIPQYDQLRINYDGYQGVWPVLVKDGSWYRFIDKDGKISQVQSHTSK